jgi:hypothetical protein
MVREDPAGQVLDACRAVTHEESARQFCAISDYACRARSPFVQQRVRLLRTTCRPAADDALELGVHDAVGQPQPATDKPLAGHAPLGQRPSKLGPGSIPSSPELVDDHCDPTVPGVGIETRLSIDRLVELLDAGRSDLEDPTDVLGGHEVPCRAEDVRPEELSAVELGLHVRDCGRGASHAKRPQSMCVLLRLYAAQEPHHIRCAGKRHTV